MSATLPFVNPPPADRFSPWQVISGGDRTGGSVAPRLWHEGTTTGDQWLPSLDGPVVFASGWRAGRQVRRLRVNRERLGFEVAYLSTR